MAVALLMTEKVLSIFREAASKGCHVEHDETAGTAKAYHGGDLVFQAIQKGKDGPWICRFSDTEHMTWTGATAI